MKDLPLNFDYCALLTDILVVNVEALCDILCPHKQYCV